MKELLRKLFQPAAMLAIMLKLAALLYYTVQMQQETERLVAQQFLLIETLNTQLQKLQQRAVLSDSERQPRQQRYRFADSPHLKRKERIESEAGMQLRSVCQHIMMDEGKRSEPYADNIGVAVGVGRNLTTYGIKTRELRAINPEFNINDHIDNISIGDKGIFIQDIETAKAILKTPLTDHHIALLLLSNLKDSADDLRRIFENWNTIDSARKEAVVDMHYNLGANNFREFKNFIGAVKRKDWTKAAEEVLLSLAAKQNPARYQRVSKVIRTGDASHFEK